MVVRDNLARVPDSKDLLFAIVNILLMKTSRLTYREEKDPVEIAFVSIEFESKPSGISNGVSRAPESRSGGEPHKKRRFVVLWVGLLLEEIGASIVFDFITSHFESSVGTSSFGVTESERR